MIAPDYSLAQILPYVRESLRGRGNFNYVAFVSGLWQVLERVGVPGVKATAGINYSGIPYDYTLAPFELRSVTTEAFYYLFHNGFTVPNPPDSLPGSPSDGQYRLTLRGLAWAASTEALPEDRDGYMKVLRTLVPKPDNVIDQYIREGLSSFERQTFFAAAVMLGAAAEKAVYLLADSILVAIKDTAREQKFTKLIEQRRLSALFDSIEETIKGAKEIIPYSIQDGSMTHLLSLFETIRVQRNDAVHPMNATVSPDSIRLSFQAFPYALQKSEALRAWFQANPKTI